MTRIGIPDIYVLDEWAWCGSDHIAAADRNRILVYRIGDRGIELVHSVNGVSASYVTGGSGVVAWSWHSTLEDPRPGIRVVRYADGGGAEFGPHLSGTRIVMNPSGNVLAAIRESGTGTDVSFWSTGGVHLVTLVSSDLDSMTDALEPCWTSDTSLTIPTAYGYQSFSTSGRMSEFIDYGPFEHYAIGMNAQVSIVEDLLSVPVEVRYRRDDGYGVEFHNDLFVPRLVTVDRSGSVVTVVDVEDAGDERFVIRNWALQTGSWQRGDDVRVEGEPEFPRWSPDGRYLGFTSSGRLHVWRAEDRPESRWTRRQADSAVTDSLEGSNDWIIDEMNRAVEERASDNATEISASDVSTVVDAITRVPQNMTPMFRIPPRVVNIKVRPYRHLWDSTWFDRRSSTTLDPETVRRIRTFLEGLGAAVRTFPQCPERDCSSPSCLEHGGEETGRALARRVFEYETTGARIAAPIWERPPPRTAPERGYIDEMTRLREGMITPEPLVRPIELG